MIERVALDRKTGILCFVRRHLEVTSGQMGIVTLKEFQQYHQRRYGHRLLGQVVLGNINGGSVWIGCD